jgi:hypothetical protein
MKSLTKFDYSPGILEELNQIEASTGLKVSSYKFYGPDNYLVELSSSVGDMAQPQDFVAEVNLQKLFKNADLVNFENGSALLEFKTERIFNRQEVEDILDQANKDMMAKYKFKLDYFDDYFIIFNMAK